jgi:hypothetical protein
MCYWQKQEMRLLFDHEKKMMERDDIDIYLLEQGYLDEYRYKYV